MQALVTKREKDIFYATVGVIVFSAVFNFFIVPAFKQNDTLEKGIKVNSAKLSKYVRLLSQKDAIHKKYNSLAIDFNVPNKQGDNAMAILAELEKLAQGSNIKIVDVRPQVSEKSTGSYKEISVDLRTEGDMEGYLRFIYNLENSLTLLKIKRFQINSKSNSSLLEGTFSIFQIYSAK